MSALINDLSLAPLFLAGTQETLLVRGGVMDTWNSSTFENSVTVGTGVYTNLPVVNPGSLTTGPVLVIKSGPSYVVLGNLRSA